MIRRQTQHGLGLPLDDLGFCTSRDASALVGEGDLPIFYVPPDIGQLASRGGPIPNRMTSKRWLEEKSGHHVHLPSHL